MINWVELKTQALMRSGLLPHASDAKMKTYYRERAPVYDRVYAYPERQDNLRYLEQYVAQLFGDAQVLEVAAGTGYWTQFLAATANSVTATDATIEALQQIQHRPNCESVTSSVVDAYSLGSLGRSYNAIFAGLWLSHVPKQAMQSFLNEIHKTLLPGATVLFIDNSAAQCCRLPISHTDQHGNSYQDRMLDDGSIHRVLKNFPTETELCEAAGAFGTNQTYRALEHFWLFQYQSY